MHRKLALVAIVLALGGCRIVSQKELADLKNPPNPQMANIQQTWQQKIVPQYVREAKPVAELLKTLQSEKSFDEACSKDGYRSQSENPCVFSVRITGEVIKVNTKSRSGKMTVRDEQGGDIVVQMGPIIRGTSLRDGYKGASYQDFNDQVLYGDYGKAINQQASAMIINFKPVVGDKVTVSGVFAAWDIPQTIPDVTAAHIVRQ
ncbi:DUF2291 domain-containing protein [Pseudescherichia sp.]|uniref:DUF2291 family protein n=1 Tax=Pseudescherichia sp. TaxID=2055881 RepID=UPI00289B7C57|nr:DUF2291 domain-containing protein [Pseudescherichia sp.]